MSNPLKVSLENIIPLTEARDHFSQIVTEVQKDKLYVLTKGGKPAVAIIDVKYLEHITGGEAKVEHIEEEIKKAPEKVGLPPMVEHASKPVPSPAAPNVPNVPKEQPKPAGFAAPATPQQNDGGQAAPMPQNNPVPKSPPPPQPIAPSPAPSVSPTSFGPATLKTPPIEGEKVDVQFYNDAPTQNSVKPGDKSASPDDKTPPAQYAGSSDGEVEDMALD